MSGQASLRNRVEATRIAPKVRYTKDNIVRSLPMSSELSLGPCCVAAFLATEFIFFQMTISDVITMSPFRVKRFWPQHAGKFPVTVWIVICANKPLQPGQILSSDSSVSKFLDPTKVSCRINKLF